jgi:hypothetical protein
MRTTRLSTMASVGLAAFLTVSLSACGGQPTSMPDISTVLEPTKKAATLEEITEGSPASSAPSSPSASASPSTSTTPAKVLVTDDLNFSCDGSDYESLKEVWDAQKKAEYWSTCSASIGDYEYGDDAGADLSEYDLTKVEQKVVEPHIVANEYMDWTERDALEDLYANCATEEMGYSYSSSGTDFSIDVEEEGKAFALTKQLCPKHPNLKEVQKVVDEETGKADQREAGTRFEDGTYRVGEEVQPGTYVSTTLEDGCYWERTNAAGDIIDNNFINSGLRAEVFIGTSDYSFHADRCGEWVRQ